MKKPLPVSVFARVSHELYPSMDPRQHYTSKGKPKQPHRSKRFANLALEHLKASPEFTPRPGRELHVYRCRICRMWHVGSLPAPQPPQGAS